MSNTPVQVFDRNTASGIRSDIDAAIQAVGEKYGITLRAGAASYDAISLNVKVTGVVAKTPSGKRPEQEEFLKHCNDWTGLKAEWLNQTFDQQGRTYTIVGKTIGARRKNCIIANRDDGKQFVVPVLTIVSFMGGRFKTS